MFGRQRNLFIEVLCEPQVVIHALVRVFQLLDLVRESLEELAERHIPRILLGSVEIPDMVKLTAFWLELGLLQCRCVRLEYLGLVVGEMEVDEPPVDILGEGNSLGVENVDWVGCKIRQQIYL